MSVGEWVWVSEWVSERATKRASVRGIKSCVYVWRRRDRLCECPWKSQTYRRTDRDPCGFPLTSSGSSSAHGAGPGGCGTSSRGWWASWVWWAHHSRPPGSRAPPWHFSSPRTRVHQGHADLHTHAHAHTHTHTAMRKQPLSPLLQPLAGWMKDTMWCI